MLSLNWKEMYQRGIINMGNPVRINRVMKKALSGQEITVGFIGGSITAGSLSSKPDTCYAYLVYSWWKDKFPMSKVVYLNAGVGATTSQYGVARVEQDLLCEEPDMIFAEFSVNDADSVKFQETFEGLVRKVLLWPTEPALFMFNNVFYDTGNNVQKIHNQVGLFYDLPIVSVKDSIYAEIVKGNIAASAITPDNLHPNDKGHKMVADLIIYLLERIYEKLPEPDTPDQMYQVPEVTVTANRYFASVLRNNRNTDPVMHGFQKDEVPKENRWDVFRNGWLGRNMGSSIRFQAEGSIISVQYRKYAIHPAPIAKVIIDGDEKKAAILDANFNETWGDCLYLQDIMTLGKAGVHTIEIVIIQAAGNKDFYLASIITA